MGGNCTGAFLPVKTALLQFALLLPHLQKGSCVAGLVLGVLLEELPELHGQ